MEGISNVGGCLGGLISLKPSYCGSEIQFHRMHVDFILAFIGSTLVGIVFSPVYGRKNLSRNMSKSVVSFLQ